MPDFLSSDQRHRNMAAIHSSSTKPEVKLRHELWRRGFRYRKNDKRLPGSPDIVLPRYRTVLFVHGCFWHGHKGCKKYTVPKTNTEFWIEKVRRNQNRDEKVWRDLESENWEVVIVWECELENKRFGETVERVEKEILRNGETYRKREAERRSIKSDYREICKDCKQKTREVDIQNS